MALNRRDLRRFEGRLSSAYARFKKTGTATCQCFCGYRMDVCFSPYGHIIALCSNPEHNLNNSRFRKYLEVAWEK